MRNSKRLLSILLAVALMVTSLMAMPVFAADEETTETEVTESGTVFSDVDDNAKYATAVTVLNKLGIITGYTDGTFGPDNNITRAEFAALLLRMMGMDQTIAPAAPPFPDVPTTLWAAGTIEASKNLGIITGYDDGTFKPDNNVSYEEALTMIIRAIKYENYSPVTDVWYSTYVTSANRLGITKDAIGNVGTPATRACIAQFIYNTLEVYARENNEISDKTVMEAYLGLIKADGIIASTAYTSLESPDVNLKENEIIIKDRKTEDTETFRVDNIDEYNDMLGASITYYYKEDISSGYKDVVSFTVKAATKTETVEADQIEADDCDDLTIVYYKSESASTTTKLDLDSNNVVIYNGKLYGNTAEASSFDTDMLPTVGSVKLLNTDGDSDYDVVFIENYEIYVVSSVTSSTYTVTDKITTTAGKSIVLDYKDDDQIIKFVDADGKELSFSSIRKNSTLCVKESNDNNGTKMITVVIVNQTATGEVKSITSDKCTVGTKTYNYSPAAAWEAEDSDIAAPEKGNTYTFFLDLNNEIVAYTKDATTQASGNYGFVMAYAKEEEGLNNSPLILYILTSSGTKTRIPLYKNTKINGEKIEDDYEYAEKLLVAAAKYQSLGYEADEEEGRGEKGGRQLIKYTTKSYNGETVLDTIVTVTKDSYDDTKGGDADAEVLRMFSPITSEDDAKYTSSTKRFTTDDATVYLGSAAVFVVPDDMTDSSEYRKGSSSDFKNKQSYKIEVFDITSSKSAKVVVLYGGSAATEVDSLTAVFRVESVTDEYNESEDKSMTMVTGYENGGTKEVTYWASPDSEVDIDDLSEGDWVRFGLDRDGYVTLTEDDILYQEGMDAYYFAWDESYGKGTEDAKTGTTVDIKVMLGSIYSTSDDTVIITPEFLEDDVKVSCDVDDETEVLRLATSKFSSAKFYTYDLTGNKIKVTAMEDNYQDIIDSFITYDEDLLLETTKVLIHIKEGSVKSVVIIEE